MVWMMLADGDDGLGEAFAPGEEDAEGKADGGGEEHGAER